MKQQKRYSPEFHDRVVRLIQGLRKEGHSEWSAMQSISKKLGCTPESIRRWVHQAQRDAGKRPGMRTAEEDELKQLGRENRELKQANEILKAASAFFAQAELDRRLK